jgi:hypothetical protein
MTYVSENMIITVSVHLILLKHGSGAFRMELHNYNLLMSFFIHSTCTAMFLSTATILNSHLLNVSQKCHGFSHFLSYIASSEMKR